ncbi:arginine N-succinyltransferase, partial [Burkholderia sp. SIMBA_057]
VSESTVEDEGIPHIVCNTQLKNFRATKLSLPAGADELILTTEQAQAMHLESGDEARIVAL